MSQIATDAFCGQGEPGCDPPADLPDGQITARRQIRVQPPLQKYFCFSEMQIRLYDLPS